LHTISLVILNTDVIENQKDAQQQIK